MADWLGDYVTVNERVVAFRAKHPDGSITTEATAMKDADGKVVEWVVKATVSTGSTVTTGYSSLAVPGKTQFSRGAELENAETSAVGRALGFLGYGITKSIASRDEVAVKAEQPDGTDSISGFIEKWAEDGFAMKAGSTRYHVVFGGSLSDAFDVGDKVKVEGRVELVPWTDKSGKKMPPYKRLTATSVENGGS